jgi:hypothetical protein
MLTGLASLLFIVYLSLAPVYWLPSVEPQHLRIFKFAIIGMAIACVWLKHGKDGFEFLKKSFLGLPGVLLILLACGGAFAQSEPSHVSRTLMDFYFAFTMFWSFYAFSGDPDRPVRIFVISASIISIFCFLTICSDLLGQPAWRPPAIFETGALSVAGFGARRTGWSNGVALYLPLLFIMLFYYRNGGILRSALFIAAVLCILGAQYTVGGRAGLLASLFAVFVVLFFLADKKYLYGWTALVVIGLFANNVFYGGIDLSSSSEEMSSHLRADRLDSGVSYETLDSFSAGRLGMLEYAVDKFFENPLGYGFGNAIYKGAEIHNVWIRLLVEGGILMLTLFLLFVILLIKKIYSGIGRIKAAYPREYKASPRYNLLLIYLTLLAQGIIISQFEPNALVGSFQATAVWWAAAGAGLRIAETGRFSQKNNPPASLKPALRYANIVR